jgi:hypothetical protein
MRRLPKASQDQDVSSRMGELKSERNLLWSIIFAEHESRHRNSQQSKGLFHREGSLEKYSRHRGYLRAATDHADQRSAAGELLEVGERAITHRFSPIQQRRAKCHQRSFLRGPVQSLPHRVNTSGEMDLHPVAVELDLLDPAVAGWHLRDQ